MGGRDGELVWEVAQLRVDGRDYWVRRARDVGVSALCAAGEWYTEGLERAVTRADASAQGLDHAGHARFQDGRARLLDRRPRRGTWNSSSNRGWCERILALERRLIEAATA